MKGCHLEKWLIPGSVLYALLSSNLCAAQVVGDTTLPLGERSQVTGNPNFQIDGGARRGGSLFHSFSQFSIPTGGSAFFNNALDVQTIFSRVTGGSLSNIDGLIRANGTANLFFLNPNGILFGPNASLNIGGSFVATTASAIGFPNGEVFSSDATQPLPSQLLNVNANALFFNQLAAQSIINRSTANNGTGLQVPAGQSLLLVGGNVQLEGGQIISPSSQVALGAVAGQGQIELNETAGNWQLTFPDGLARSDVSLSDGAVVNVRAGGGGSITVTAGNLSLSGESRLRAGIDSGVGFTEAQGGNIQLDATEALTLADGSVIDNVVRFGGTGNAGNITITTRLLSIIGDAEVSNYTEGQGSVGNINITARNNVSLDGGYIVHIVDPTGVGSAGDITITTGSLAFTRGGQLIASMDGQGNAGSVNINAHDSVSLDGSAVFNTVGQTGIGNTGGINITTGSLSLTRGGQLLASTDGQGNVGSVNINAHDSVSLDGDNSVVYHTVGQTGIGNTGGINITTGSLSLTRGASLASGIFGQGDIGPVNINARNTVALDGENADVFPSAIFSVVGNEGVGNAGGINIQAQQLILKSNAALIGDVGQTGQGRGGNINLDISDTILLLGGTTADTGESARITLGVQPDGIGSGANLRIRAGSLVLQDGGLIKASTQGQGDAGNIDITADRVDISGSVPTSGLPSGLFTSSDTAGNAGDITINTQTFRIADGAALSARSRGDGQGGDITINAARTFEALNGGQLITTTFGQGQAGKITVNAAEQIVIAGSDPNYATRLARFPNLVDPLVANAISETGAASGLFANTEPSSAGRGGDIQITTGQLTVQAGAQLITNTSGNGRAGDITINTPDLQLSGATSRLFAGTTSAGDAGNLTIQPRGNEQSVRVNLQGGAQISASTSSSGNGGELKITAPDSITLTGDGSVIAAGTGGGGVGGNLKLTTDTLNIQNQAEVTVSSEGTGSAGSLEVDANQIYLDNQGRIRADTTGGGGNITLRSPLILLRNGSSITTDARGSNIPGGNISIDTDNLVAVPNENSDISANSADFRGGNVTIRASGIFGIEFRERITPLSDITATGVSEGTVNLITPGIDPSRGLAELPTDVVDVSNAIAQGCRDVQGSSFVATGRGGLPPTPQQALGDDPRWRDWRTPAVVSRQPNVPGNGTLPPSANLASTKSALVEATGWMIEPDGKVILTASVPNVTSPNRRGQPVNCDGS
jgi:filamentous hemagglutinin family protein